MTTVESTNALPGAAGLPGADGSSDDGLVDTSARPPRAWDQPRGARRLGRYALLAIVVFVVLFPIYTTVVAAISPPILSRI